MVGFPARAVVRWLLLVCAAAVTAGVPSACPYADGSLVDDLLAAYPLLPVHARAQAVALSGLAGAAEEAGGSFSILRAALDASSTRCAGNFTLGGGQTVFAATDRAWTALEGQLGRGLSEILADGQLLCALLSYSVVLPCSGALTSESTCGPLATRSLVDQQALATAFSDPALLQSDAASGTLYMAVQQRWAKRSLHVTGYLKRGAALIVPDLTLCEGALVVHVVDAVLVPAAALYASIERRLQLLPELSITAEAFERVRPFRVAAPEIQPSASSPFVTAQVAANIAVEPLIPPPRLPAAGMCRAGVPLAESVMRTLLAPTDAAWKVFFERLGLSKEAVFADLTFLLSLLDYLEVEVLGLDRPYSPDGLSAGSRFFSYDFFRGQLLRSLISPVYLPFGTLVTAFGITVDVLPLAGNARTVAFLGQPFLASEGSNAANLLAPDLIACNGLVHVVDAVLIPPTLTTLQQISFRPELSVFRQLLYSPGLEFVRRSLGTEIYSPGGFVQRAVSIAVWVPTNGALLTALAYLGLSLDDILVPLIDPIAALAVRTQLVVYHTTPDALQRGLGRALRGEVLRTPLLAQGDVLQSLLLSPILQKPCNVFLLTAAPLALVVSVRGVQSHSAALAAPPPGYPAPSRDILLNGRLNSARVIVPDIVSVNGVLQVLDTALLPPTQEVGMTVLARIERTPGLAVYEKVALALGLQLELGGRCLSAGDVSVWAPVDAAWAAFFVRLSLDLETLLSGAKLPLLYDIMLYSWITADAAPSPLEPQFIGGGEAYATALQKQWAVPAFVRFDRNDTAPLPLSGGEVLTSLFISGGDGPPKLVPRDARGNSAQLLPPELLKGQLALNGDLHVTDRVIVPGGAGGPPLCRLADFEFFGGRAFESAWPAGVQPIATPPLPRARELPGCAALPCTYPVGDLYARGTRLSLEITATYQHLVALCDPWCSPEAYWWCIPCTGAYGQTLAILGGCAPYQLLCGGALALWVTDAGELRWGALTYATTFGLAAPELGGGLRVVDVSVPGRGMVLKHGQTFKVLATFDNVCQCVKLYVNDKLRGIGDPAQFARFGWPRFANVTGNTHEKVTLGAAWHATGGGTQGTTSPAVSALLSALQSGGVGSTPLSAAQTAARLQDISIPTFGGAAVWPSDPLLQGAGGGAPTQLYLPWKGTIQAAFLWLDNFGQRSGIIYPSACLYPGPPEPSVPVPPPNAQPRVAPAAPPRQPPPHPPPSPPPSAPPPSPALAPPGVDAGSCGGICGLCTGCIDAACACCCDAACADMGDCCPDYRVLCVASGNATILGVNALLREMARLRPVSVASRRTTAP